MRTGAFGSEPCEGTSRQREGTVTWSALRLSGKKQSSWC